MSEVVKFSIEDIEAVFSSAREITNDSLPVKPSYWLSKFLKKVETEMKHYEETKNKLLYKYGQKKEDNPEELELESNGEVKFTPENKKAFYEELDVLRKIDIEMDVTVIDITEFKNSKLPVGFTIGCTKLFKCAIDAQKINFTIEELNHVLRSLQGFMQVRYSPVKAYCFGKFLKNVEIAINDNMKKKKEIAKGFAILDEAGNPSMDEKGQYVFENDENKKAFIDTMKAENEKEIPIESYTISVQELEYEESTVPMPFLVAAAKIFID